MLKWLDVEISSLSLEKLIEMADDLSLTSTIAYDENNLNLFEECATFLEDLEIEIRCREVFSKLA